MASNPNGQVRRRKKFHQDIPDLPHNKSYHLFVCYSKENRKEVMTIVGNLADYGIKCGFHDEHFQPGKTIFKNIDDAIRLSVGIMIVLSETFVSSNYCKFEIEEALQKYIEEEYQVIPLKLEPCDVPRELLRFSYINATEDGIEDVHLKIINSVIEKEIREEEKRNNGNTMVCPLTEYKICKFSFTRYRLQIDQRARNELLGTDFEVSSELFDTAEEIVNRSPIVKYHYISLSSQKYFWILQIPAIPALLLILLVFLVVLLLTSGKTASENLITPPWLVLSICLPLLFVVWFASGSWFKPGFSWLVTFRKQEQLKLNNDLWDNVNSRFGRNTKIFVFYHKYSFHVMRLNLKPCKDVFLRKLRNRPEVQVQGNHMDYTNRVFDHFLRNEIHLLNVKSETKRHNMATGSKCPCLLVEERLFPEKLNTSAECQVRGQASQHGNRVKMPVFVSGGRNTT